jgi:hypothetical protein
LPAIGRCDSPPGSVTGIGFVGGGSGWSTGDANGLPSQFESESPKSSRSLTSYAAGCTGLLPAVEEPSRDCLEFPRLCQMDDCRRILLRRCVVATSPLATIFVSCGRSRQQHRQQYERDEREKECPRPPSECLQSGCHDAQVSLPSAQPQRTITRSPISAVHRIADNPTLPDSAWLSPPDPDSTAFVAPTSV